MFTVVYDEYRLLFTTQDNADTQSSGVYVLERGIEGPDNLLTRIKRCFTIWRWQVRASSYNSNKLTNQMQQFYKFITWRFVSFNMFRAPPRPNIRSLQLH